MVADLNQFCFSLGMEGGEFLRVKSQLDNLPKFFQECIFMAWGIDLRWSYLSALNILFMEWLKKARFEFADFIVGFVPNSDCNCVPLFRPLLEMDFYLSWQRAILGIVGLSRFRGLRQQEKTD